MRPDRVPRDATQPTLTALPLENTEIKRLGRLRARKHSECTPIRPRLAIAKHGRVRVSNMLNILVITQFVARPACFTSLITTYLSFLF